MADHTLDREPGIARIADDINTLKNQLSELRTLQLQGASAVNMQSTGTYSETSVSVVANGAAIFGFHLNLTGTAVLFCIFSYSIYVGTTTDEAHLLGGSNSYGYTHRWVQWRDWGEANLPGHVYNISDRIWLYNQDTVAHVYTINAEWRYIVTPGTVSIS